MPSSSGPSGSTAKADGSTSGCSPTLEADVRDERVVEQGHAAAPRSATARLRPRLVRVRSVGSRAVVLMATMLVDRWPAHTGHFAPTLDRPLCHAPRDPRPVRPAAARPPARRPGPTPGAGRHPAPGDRLPSTRRLAADLGRRPVGHRAGVGPAPRRGLDRGPPRRRHVGGRRRRARSPAAPAASHGPGGGRPAGPPRRRHPWIDARHRAAWRRAWREVSSAPRRGGTTTRAASPSCASCSPSAWAAPGAWSSTPTTWWSPPAPPPGCATCWPCSRREPVAVEDPGYRAAVLTVGESGRAVRRPPGLAPVTDLAGACAAYVTPAHQHPLGRVMPAADRLTLLATARRDGAVVVEDDYDSEFRYDVAPVPALASLEPDLVAYLGTASKSVAPSLRLGWLVAPPRLRPDLDRHRGITHDAPGLAGPARLLGAAARRLRRRGRPLGAPDLRRACAARGRRAVAVRRARRTGRRDVLDLAAPPRPRGPGAAGGARHAGFRVNLLADYCRSVRPHRAGRRLRRPHRRAARRGTGRAGPLARRTCRRPRRGSGAVSPGSRRGTPPRPRPARARSCGRGSRAEPHSSAKMPPRTNIIGTRKPMAMAATWSTQPRA